MGKQLAPSHLVPWEDDGQTQMLHPAEEECEAQLEDEAECPRGLAFPESNLGFPLSLSCL